MTLKNTIVWIAFLMGTLPSLLCAQGRQDTIVDNTIVGPAGGAFNPLVTQPAVILNNNGDIVFRAGESGQSAGLFFYQGSDRTFSSILRTGDSIDGNGTANNISQARLNEAGDVAFDFSILGATGGSSQDSAIAGWDSMTGLEIKVREGVTAIDGATAGHVSTTSLQGLFSNGEVGFNLDLTGASTESDWGAYRTDGSQFVQAYREDSVNNLFESRVKFNSSGEYSLITSNDMNIVSLKKNGSNLTTASNTSNEPFYLIDGPVIDDNGNVYFTGEVTSSSNTHNLYRASAGGGVVEIATHQGLALGGGVNDVFGTFSGVGIATSDGYAAFTNTIDTSSDNVEALFRSGPAGLIRLATEGDAAPDGNGAFGIWGNLSETSTSSYSVNRTGIVAFENFLAGTSGGNADDQGIFLTDGIDMVTAVREGDSIDGMTVSNILWNGGRESDHQSTAAFNDFGQVAYRARLGSEWKIQLFTPDLHYRSTVDGSWDDHLNWTLSLDPAKVHDVYIDPINAMTVSGPSGISTVRSLTVGGNGNATFQSQAGGTLNAVEGTTLLGDGRLTGEGTLLGETQSAGVIAPGNSAGTLTLGSLNLLAGSEVQIELGGVLDSEFDRLLIVEDATLDGMLNVSLINGFSLEQGMLFDFLGIGGTYSGAFEGLNDGDLVGVFGGTDLYIDYHSGGVSFFTASSVPEPGSSIAIVLVGLLCVRRRRHRTQGF